MANDMVDWQAIKTEYITSNTSYRKLAKKHGVPTQTLTNHATVEKWFDEKKQFKNKVEAKALKNAERQATDYKSTLYNLAYKVANQLVDMTDNHSIEELALAGIKPKDITGAIKDLEDALHIKSEPDLREQEARIKNLQKQADSVTDDKPIKVIIEGDAEEFAK